MAVQAEKSADRLIVKVTWDKSIVTGEVVQLYCVNPENGDVSNSGLSRNDGEGAVSYPLGYTGTSEITVYDNDGNADVGIITVGDDGSVETDPDAHPEHPIVLPPDTDLHPEHPIHLPPEGGTGEEGGGGERPEHPIYLPPTGIWPNPPGGEAPDQGLPGDQPRPDQGLPGEQPGPDHELPGGGEPPSIWPEPGFPSHPIVIPPVIDDDFWTGNLPPFVMPHRNR
jgi:hypothetical protein